MTATSAEAHATVLSVLLNLKGKRLIDSVWLVSKWVDGEGGEPLLRGAAGQAVKTGVHDPSVYVFVPDLHLLTRSSEQDFTYGFLTVERDSMYVDRGRLLAGVLDSVRSAVFADPWKLRVIQMGDFVDIWREADSTTPHAEVAAIVNDNQDVVQALKAVGAEKIRGNHDYSAAMSPHLQAVPHLKLGPSGSQDILVTHGDMFDDLEQRVPDSFQDPLVRRFGKNYPSTTYVLDRTGHKKRARECPEGSPITKVASHDDVPKGVVNVWRTKFTAAEAEMWDWDSSHELLYRAFTDALYLRGADPTGDRAAVLGRFDLGQWRMPAVRTVVIGHSHEARICVHTGAGSMWHDKTLRTDLVLVDTGAWIEKCKINGKEAPSCQICVLCGGEIRIYQLTPHSDLLSNRLPPANRILDGLPPPPLAAFPPDGVRSVSIVSPKPKRSKGKRKSA